MPDCSGPYSKSWRSGGGAEWWRCLFALNIQQQEGGAETYLLVGRLQQEADLEPGLQLPFVQPGSRSNGMSQWFPH